MSEQEQIMSFFEQFENLKVYALEECSVHSLRTKMNRKLSDLWGHDQKTTADAFEISLDSSFPEQIISFLSQFGNLRCIHYELKLTFMKNQENGVFCTL